MILETQSDQKARKLLAEYIHRENITSALDTFFIEWRRAAYLVRQGMFGGMGRNSLTQSGVTTSPLTDSRASSQREKRSYKGCSWPSLCENSWLENKTCMRTPWFVDCAYRVLKEATLMRVFQVLREGKIVFTQPRPYCDKTGSVMSSAPPSIADKFHVANAIREC